jgi:hypothetical protein
MAKRLFGTVVLAVTALVVLATPASAASVAKFSGDAASAGFGSVDASGCVFTSAFVFGVDQSSHRPPGAPTPESFLSLFIDQFNQCTQTELLLAQAVGVQLDAADFQVNSTLTTATLNRSSISAFDFVSGSTILLSVNLTWTATGPLGQVINKSQFHSRNCKVSEHFDEKFRDAQATGSISNGTTNFTPSPSTFAQIQQVKQGQITIGCQ